MNHLDPSATRIPQENLHHAKPSTASRYLFPSPRPCIIPQENPHYMTNPPISYSYSHLLQSSQPAHIPPPTLYGQPMNNYYIPQYPSASIQGGGTALDVKVRPFMPAASGFSHEQANQVADGKFESKGQDQVCGKKMSDTQPKKDDAFKATCYGCGSKFHKADDCPSKGAPNNCKKKKMSVDDGKFESEGQDQVCGKKMSDKQPKKDDAFKGTCYSCGGKFHKAGDCPSKGAPNNCKKKKMSSEDSCFRCGEKDHKAGDCTRKKKMLDGELKNNGEGPCFRCGEENHKAKNCPQKKKKISGEQLGENGDNSKDGQGQKTQTFEGPCYRCGEENHIAKNCPQKNKISGEQLEGNGDNSKDGQDPKAQTIEGPCYRCGEENHKAKNCPKKKKKISDEQLEEKGDNSIDGSGQKTQTFGDQCWHCGEENHKYKNCPRTKKISGEQLKENDDHSKDRQGCQQLMLPTHGKSLIGNIIHQLCLMRFDGEGSVCEYILHMENLVRQLSDLKMEVSDDFLVHMVINSLPQVFDTVKLNYYSSTDLWNVNELIAHCVHEEVKHEQNA